MPWFFHLASCVVIYLVLRHSFFKIYDGIRLYPWEIPVTIYTPFVLGALPLGPAVYSWWRSRQRRSWVLQQRTLNDLRRLSWQKFEVLVGAAFEQLGYVAQEVGGGGADGGMDLILSKNNKKVLVQCKHWKTGVGAPVVREMFGLMVAEKMDAVMIVTSGKFTKDAQAFAKGKTIVLIDGEALLKLIKNVQIT